MEKEFIQYEQALALKELGFDEPCLGYFNTNNRELFLDNSNNRTSNDDDRWCSAPTFSQAFRWFRDNYKLQTRPVFKMIDETEFEYSFMPNDLKNKWYKTYEEAELECLKKLIELVKNTEQ